MLYQENIAPSNSPQKSETRLKLYKNNRLESAELKRRRIDVSAELRKAKRESEILKRRNIAVEEENGQAILQYNETMENLNCIVERMKSVDPAIQLTGVQCIRRLLSTENHSLTNNIIEGGLVFKLVEFLGQANSDAMQFEAAWILANIASGTSHQTRAVVEAGALPYFIHLLSSRHKNISEQAIWGIANIAGDGPELRDCVINSGVISPLISLIRSQLHFQQQGTYFKNIIWTLSNLCCHKDPPPSYDTVVQLLPTLTGLLHQNDKEIVSDVCRIFSRLTDSSSDRIELVVNCGIIPRLVSFVVMGDGGLQESALRTIGNIVTSKEKHVKMIIDSGVLNHFALLLMHQNVSIQKEAAWTISNITAGPKEHIEAVISHNLVPFLVTFLVQGPTEEVQREAVWAVGNITAGGTPQQVYYLLQTGVLKPLCVLLNAKDAKILVVILEAMTNIIVVRIT